MIMMARVVVALWSIIALGLGKNGIHAKQFASLSGASVYFQDLTDYPTSQIAVSTSKSFPDWVIQYRGGQRWNDGDDENDDNEEDGMDDNDDDEYDNEAEDEDDTLQKNRHGPATDRYDHSIIDPPSARSQRSSKGTSLPHHSQDQVFQNDHSNARPNLPNRQSSRRRRRPPQHWTQRIASQGFKVGSQLAWGAVQQTGNVAYQLIKPRHVDPAELQGLWRLDQQIVTAKGVDMASVATIAMDPRHKLVTLKLPNGKATIVEPYTLQKTRWGSFQTEFIVPAFLVGDTPRWYGYRGTWQRKLADQRVIKLVGKIYQVKQPRFGNSKAKYVFSQPVGTFVARRRMKLQQDDDDDDDDDEEEEYSNNDGDQQDNDGQDYDNDYDDEDDDAE